MSSLTRWVLAHKKTVHGSAGRLHRSPLRVEPSLPRRVAAGEAEG